ncbi:hypothetical protein EJ04DRAFT_545814 [Polyplosphaeria fusca]|uniref:Uncharacterized protein n=1 Tax=Polyplosphaeria fusca TaxID=682080 RepID=A0A9P4UYR8_9PLEO|nr:hypothetical protein EJ04DRAFT_545814 [Polyplosphaeria fusca]
MESASVSYAVHLGFWTNWSHGKIMGATVTLTRANGGLLIATLAIFIGMVGKSFWRLGCFCLHRYFSSADRQDGLYHQRQAILRNSDTAQDGAWRLLMSLLAWRSGRRATRPLLRLLPILIYALVVSAAFGIASIFSANVTTETLNEVLLKSERCGPLNENMVQNSTKQLTELYPYYTQRASQFLNYGLQCYTNSTSTDGCNLYIRPQLPFKATRDATCPFKDNICKLENENLILDTGYLDSLDHLGINSAPNERFQLRFVQHCAPLKTEGYTEDFNDTNFGPVRRMLYGPQTPLPGFNGTRWSYEVATNNSYIPTDGTLSSGTQRYEYTLGLFSPGVNKWMPIPALLRDDADVFNVYLSAPRVHFSAPIDDPLFAAHVRMGDLGNVDTGEDLASYTSDEPIAPMSCAVQMQYCNPNKPEGSRCEPLRGMSDPRSTSEVQKVFGDGSHFEVIKHANKMWTGSVYFINNLVSFVGASALRARLGLAYGYSGPLPSTQWHLEAEHWFKGTLASIQDAFVAAASGQPASLAPFLDAPAPNATISQSLCRNQKIVSTNYMSFNVLGVSLVFLLGSLIILCDTALEPTVSWFQRRRYRAHQLKTTFYPDEAHPLYAALEWSHTSTLQLQRLAHEEAGWGTWSACDGDTPVTLPGQRLGALNLGNVRHPVLKVGRPGSAQGQEEGDMMVAGRAWGVRRTDTGVETLVEGEGEGYKRVGEEDGEDESLIDVRVMFESQSNLSSRHA